MSFGQRASLKKPYLFNESNTVNYIVAPFWSDMSTRTSGSVSYVIHTNKTSSSLLHTVSKFIRHMETNQFSGTWMLLAEWNSIPQPGTINN